MVPSRTRDVGEPPEIQRASCRPYGSLNHPDSATHASRASTGAILDRGDESPMISVTRTRVLELEMTSPHEVPPSPSGGAPPSTHHEESSLCDSRRREITSNSFADSAFHRPFSRSPQAQLQ